MYDNNTQKYELQQIRKLPVHLRRQNYEVFRRKECMVKSTGWFFVMYTTIRIALGFNIRYTKKATRNKLISNRIFELSRIVKGQ